jgi:hypothetical protein
MEKEGVNSNKTKQIEKELVKAIKNQRGVDYKIIGNKILNGVEISSKVVVLIKNFLALVGFVA